MLPLILCLYEAETNQELITIQSGIKLLSSMANAAIDPQTMRMVAGAIANLAMNGNFDGMIVRIMLCENLTTLNK